MKSIIRTTFLLVSLLFVFNEILAQVDTSYFNGLEYRGIGPYRGGRSCAVTGVPSNPAFFYFGSTGGGVWKSETPGQRGKIFLINFLADQLEQLL